MATSIRYNPDGTRSRVVSCPELTRLGALDWGVVRSLSRRGIEKSVLACDGFLAHDSTFVEAVGASSIDGAKKLAWFLSSFGQSIWFGRSLGDVHAMECERGSPISAREIVHAEYSAKLQAIASWSSQSKLRSRLQAFVDFKSPSRFGTIWMRDAREYGRVLAENFVKAGSPFSRSDEQLESFVSDPGLGKLFSEYTIAQTDRLGSSFLERPLDFAFGRFMAIWTWHAARAFLVGSKPTPNDWHDSHYLFLASYCGVLVTNETSGSLVKAAKTLFPSTRILANTDLFVAQAA